MPAPLRVAFVTSRLPWPLLRGDQLRAFHQLRLLGRKHRITLICFSEGSVGPGSVSDFCERIVTVPLARAGMARGALRRVFSDVPFQTALYESERMRRAVRDVLRGGCDLLHVQLARMAPYLAEFDGPRVLDLVDALSVSMRRRARRDHPLARWVFRIESERLRRYERRLCASADAVVVASGRDREEIGSFPNLSVASNAVDLPRFPFARDGRDSSTLVFTGNMGYFPNADAAVWFARRVLPRIREEQPAVRLRIGGARPTREVRRLAAGDATIEVMGRVEDMGGLLRGAAVAVVPLQAGAGQQFKVLEAMASGTPVVATTLAAEGLEARAGEHLLVAEGAGAFAESTVALLRDHALADRLARRARRLVEEKYTWERSVADLEEAYRRALEGATRASA